MKKTLLIFFFLLKKVEYEKEFSGPPASSGDPFLLLKQSFEIRKFMASTSLRKKAHGFQPS